MAGFLLVAAVSWDLCARAVTDTATLDVGQFTPASFAGENWRRVLNRLGSVYPYAIAGLLFKWAGMLFSPPGWEFSQLRHEVVSLSAEEHFHEHCRGIHGLPE